MWINSATGATFATHADIRMGMKTVSFPAVITDEDLAGVGVHPVVMDQLPVFDSILQNCEAGDISMVNGSWVRGWIVTDKTAEVIEAEAAQRMIDIAVASTVAIQNMLDAECKKHEYDTINNAAGWASRFADAAALADWGAACWAKSKQMRDEFLAGERTLPSVDEVLAEMPNFHGIEP